MRFPARVSRGGRVLVQGAVLIWACMASAASLRDDYLISRWETDDGLPENSATAMAQTREGYLWFGTFNGLVRTDGAQFKVFHPNNTPGLPGAQIINLHHTPDGRLWISTDKGIASLANGEWRRHGEGTAWTNRIVRTFAGNAAGVLLATSFDGALCRLEEDALVELPAPLPRRTQGAGFHGHVDPDGTLWALRHDFFGRWDGAAWQAVDVAGVTNGFQSAVTARDGGLWVLTKSQLLKLQAGRLESSTPLSASVDSPWAMMEDPDGSLWVPSHEFGLYHIGRTGQVAHHTVADGLSYNSLRFALRGRCGSLWVGTSGGGLMRLRPRLFRTFDTETRLPVRAVKSVAELAPGVMALATFGGGVHQLDLERSGAMLTPAARGVGFAQCTLVDRAGRRWTGFHDSPVALVSSAGVRHLTMRESGGRSVSALFEDAEGQVWLGGSEQIIRHRAGQFEPVPGPAGGRIGGVRSFAQSPADGTIWAASVDGLFRWRGATAEAVPGPAGKPFTAANCLHAEADGTVWVGGTDQGFWRWQNGVWSAVTTRHGLPSDTVGAVLDDGLGFWWLATTRGVVRIARGSLAEVLGGRAERLEAVTFGLADGLASAECPTGFQPTATKDSAGRLWFATLKGVAMVEPRTFRLDRRPPQTVIEAISYVDRQGQRQHPRWTPGTPVVLPPGATQFEVRYTAPAAFAPDRLRFRQEWTSGRQAVETQETEGRVARAALLPPGDYVLRVLAKNRHGVWSTEPAELAFVLQPFLWQTGWFRVLASLAGAAAVVAGIWNLRRRELARRNAELAGERALAEERARLAAVMEGTTDAVGFMDPDLTLRYLNAAGHQMLGLPDGPLPGQLRLRELYPLTAAEFITGTAVAQAVAEGTWSGEVLMVRRDGREFPVSQVIVAHFVAGRLQFLSTIIRNLSERKASEEALAAALKHARLLAELGRNLSEAASAPEAARLVMEAADELIHWDCAWVRLWHPERSRFERVFGYDTVAGQRQEFESTTGEWDAGSPLAREVVVHGARLILRTSEGQSVAGLRPFGGDRRSLSLMFVPMRHAGRVVGVVSVQTYQAKAYNATHLELLQSLADHCAGNLHRIAAESALRASENRWRLAMSVARIGTWDWNFVTDQVTASPELAPMFGGPGVGGLLAEPDFHQFIHAEDRPAVDAAIQSAKDQRGAFHSEFRVVWRDGSVHWIEARGEVFADAAGQPERMVGISADVTERRLAESRLRLLSQTLKSIRDCVAVADLNDRLVFVNEAFLAAYGYTEAEIVGQPSSCLRGETPPGEVLPDILAATLQEGSWHGEVLNRRKDGGEFPVELWTSVVRGADGQPIATVGVARDISERRRMETQLRHSQKMEGIGQLAGGVAHDFNNLLTVIHGHVALLLEEPELPAAVRQSLGEISHSANRAAELTRQLLTFSRRQPLKIAPCDLNVIVPGLGRMLQRLVGEPIAIQLRLAGQRLNVRADAAMLEQALLNLVINARDAMPHGGSILVETGLAQFDEHTAAQNPPARPGTFVTLAVSDTGHGISATVLPHIFEPFFTTKEVGRGTGLGLATVFGIVQQHQGWVTVHSEPGRGTTFRLYLPHRPEDGAIGPPAATGRPAASGHGETILVVEDEASLRTFLVKMLSRLGYQVLEAPNGPAALAVWAEHRDAIRLVITDMVMPAGMTGSQLAEQLRAERPTLPVIFTSGYSAEAAGRGLPESERPNFLSKPFETSTLAHLVRARLRS